MRCGHFFPPFKNNSAAEQWKLNIKLTADTANVPDIYNALFTSLFSYS